MQGHPRKMTTAWLSNSRAFVEWKRAVSFANIRNEDGTWVAAASCGGEGMLWKGTVRLFLFPAAYGDRSNKGETLLSFSFKQIGKEQADPREK
jgi:hypothetical protein